MSKDDVIEFEGVVQEAQRNAVFQVKLDNGAMIVAHLSGKLRMNNIKVLSGDRVKIQMSVYDLSKGRIVWRGKS